MPREVFRGFKKLDNISFKANSDFTYVVDSGHPSNSNSNDNSLPLSLLLINVQSIL